MNLNEYQSEARLFAVNNDLMHFMFGLLEEAGEAAGVLKRVYREDDSYWDDWDKNQYGLSHMAVQKLKAELGDILWHVALVADSLDFPLEEIANYNLYKLQSRKQRDMIKGSGDDR